MVGDVPCERGYLMTNSNVQASELLVLKAGSGKWKQVEALQRSF